MSWENIRTYTAGLVRGVSGIGNVYEYKRHWKFWSQIYDNAVVGNLLNNWEITRADTVRTIDAVGNAAGNLPYFRWNHKAVIIGHMSLNDDMATEQVFQLLVTNIIKALNGDPIMGNPNLLLVPSPKISSVIKEIEYAKVLCHTAEITFDAIERTTGGN
jgi:hypothetical protein